MDLFLEFLIFKSKTTSELSKKHKLLEQKYFLCTPWCHKKKTKFDVNWLQNEHVGSYKSEVY